jgi:hypothetical protein
MDKNVGENAKKGEVRGQEGNLSFSVGFGEIV